MARLFVVLLFVPFTLQAQMPFSMATDASLLKSFDNKQKFMVFGQSVSAQWHVSNTGSVYGLVTYHLNGKYKYPLVAEAKQPTTQPNRVSFTNRAEMRLRQVSIGYKHYFRGSYGNDNSFNLCGMGGFGMVIGRAINIFSTPIDTAQYSTPNNIVEGSGNFKRLTMDVTAGFEISVGYELFLYTEARVHIPTTDYPSNFLLKNDNTPFLAGINLGIRILFGKEE